MLDALINYGIKHNLITERDRDCIKNQLIDILQITDPYLLKQQETLKNIDHIDQLLAPILQFAVDKGIISSTHPDFADLLDSKIMGIFCDKASHIQKQFEKHYQESPQKATTWFYQYCIALNYIRINRINKNIQWISNTTYGNLEITINLSKPEKDPLVIAAQKNTIQTNYPLCLLCKENEGFTGNLSHPARQNFRIIKMELCQENWYFQYSPYIYYLEHSILLAEQHRPMKINQQTFQRLLTFLDYYPHYFIGSNADIPIVGGSILSHDHYQTGNHIFPINNASILKTYHNENITYEILDWPLSVIRLSSSDPATIIQQASSLLDYWSSYNNPQINIFSHTDNVPHNTITPIARKTKKNYQLYLVLRNNKTSPEHPFGIYHAHIDKHHIKKENIGLIEVMGLAILPGRLSSELIHIKEYLLNNTQHEEIQKHLPWLEKIKNKHTYTDSTIDNILKQEIGLVFASVLEDCGVFKKLEDFVCFFDSWRGLSS